MRCLNNAFYCESCSKTFVDMEFESFKHHIMECNKESDEKLIKDNDKQNGAYKQTTGKAQWHLLHYPSIEQIVKVREYGVKKYGTEDGWQNVPRIDYLDASMRHLTAMMKGEENDSESGLPHAAHLACNAMFLMEVKE